MNILPNTIRPTDDILQIFSGLGIGGFNLFEGRWHIPAKWVSRCVYGYIRGYEETNNIQEAKQWAVNMLKSNPTVFDEIMQDYSKRGTKELVI